MPVALVDPNIAPVGAGIPNSPLVNSFGAALSAYGRNFPTQNETSEINSRNAATDQIKQKLAAPGQLAGVFTDAMTPQTVTDPSAPPVEAPVPDGTMGPGAPTQPTRPETAAETARRVLPSLVQASANDGHVENSAALGRLMTAYMPQTPGEVNNSATHPGQISGFDQAALGAGESFESTPAGFAAKNQNGFTTEQKNRNAKIQNIMATQGVDNNTAAGLVDGVVELTTDQNGNRVMVNKATGAHRLVASPNNEAIIDPSWQGGGAGGVATPSPGSPPVVPGASPVAPGGMPGTPGPIPVSGASGALPNALKFTLGQEGGLAATDGASGAPALYGINAKWHPAEFAKAQQITQEQGPAMGQAYAADFYKKNYWDATGLNQVQDPGAAMVAFDGAVNHYPGFANKLITAAKGGATADQLLQMRSQEYARLGAITAPDGSHPYASSVPAWDNRLKALAQSTGATGQNITNDALSAKVNAAPEDATPMGDDGQPIQAGIAAPGSQAPAGPTPVNASINGAAPFKVAPGALQAPFSSMYGGPAVASRAQHMLGAVTGSNTEDPAQNALGNLNKLKNGIVQAASIMPGRANNPELQNRLLQSFPETDSNLLYGDNAKVAATVSPADAESKFNQGIEDAATMYDQANEALKSPYIDQKTRDAYQQVKSTVQKTFQTSLPAPLYNQWADHAGTSKISTETAPVSEMSNLDRGNAVTAAPDSYPTVRTSTMAAKTPIGSIFRDASGNLIRHVAQGRYDLVKAAAGH